MTSLPRTLSVCLASALFAWSVSALAGHDRWSRADPPNFAPPTVGQQPHSTAAQRSMSLAQAVDAVQRATGGKVLDAKDVGGQYRIKVLTRNGEVRVIYVDPATGAMR